MVLLRGGGGSSSVPSTETPQLAVSSFKLYMLDWRMSKELVDNPCLAEGRGGLHQCHPQELLSSSLFIQAIHARWEDVKRVSR